MKKAHLLFTAVWAVVLSGCPENKNNDQKESDNGESPTDGDTDSDGLECNNSAAADEGPYAVHVNGTEVAVTRISRFETPINFVRFDYSKNDAIEIVSSEEISEFKLSPESRNIDASMKGDTISFTAPGPEYLILQPDSPNDRKILERLIILIDPPEQEPLKPDDADVVNIMDSDGVDPCGETLMTEIIQAAIDSVEETGKILYFPKGTYLTGELWMRSGMTLYLADGAVLRGSSELSDIVTENRDGATVEQCLHGLIRMYGVTNSHISGRGVIDANGTAHRIEEDAATKYNLLKIEESSACTVDGVVAVDSSFWNTIIYRSEDIHLTNYKVINNWLSKGWNETDGVDFDNAADSSLKNAFLYTGDDCMSTKSDDIPDDYVPPDWIDNYPADPTVDAGDYIAVHNIAYEDVVCFTNQTACKVGTKTMGTQMSNIAFKNIDVPNCGRGLVIDNMDTATVQDVTFENIEFEFFGPFDVTYFVIQAGTDWRKSEGRGAIENTVINNVVLNDFNGLKPMFRIHGRTDSNTGEVYPIGDVTFTDVYLGGVHIVEGNTEETIRLNLVEADSVTFK